MSITAAKLQVEAGYADKGADRGLDNLGKKVDRAGKGLRGLDDDSKILSHGFKALGIVAVGTGVLMAGMFAATAGPAMEFEKTMSGVKAVSNATGEEFKALSGLALQLGKDTVFSASEAAKGIEELVKGGISITDVLGGAADAALNLASAGAVPLTVAAEQMADAMNIFGLKGTEAAHVADLIAGAANASSMTVTDFGFALKMAGAVAKISGQDFDSTATAIAVMAAAGLKGSDAGTSLKTMMLNLQPTTKTQIGMFKELGLLTEDNTNLFIDQTGKMKPMAEIAQILQEHTKDLTAAQKTLSLEIAFGSDAIRAAAIMAEAGAEGFAKMTAEMSKVTAVEVARERLNNLAGDMEQMKGSAETLAIMIGGSFSDVLRDGAKGLTGMLNAGIESFDGLQKHADALLANGLAKDKWEATLFAISASLKVSFGPETALLFEGFTNQVDAAKQMVEGFFKSAKEGGPGWVEAVSGHFSAGGRAIDGYLTKLGDVIIAAELMRRETAESFRNMAVDARGVLDMIDPAGAEARTRAASMAHQRSDLIDQQQRTARLAAANTATATASWQTWRDAKDAAAAAALAGGADISTPTGAPPPPGAAAPGGPSRTTTPAIGRQVAQQIEASKPEALSAIDGFMKELTSSAGTFEADFGKTGGGLASALATTIADGTPQAGARVGSALQKMVADLAAAGVPEWQELGDTLAAALHTAMISPSEEATLAVHALIIENTALMQSARELAKAEADAVKEAERLIKEAQNAWKPGQGFFGAVTEVAKSDALLKQYGEAGAAGVAAYAAAWDGDHNAEAKAANAIQRMIGEARKAGLVDANEMGRQIIDTLGQALATGDEGLRDIGLAALEAYSARMDAAKLQTEEMAASIKKMVDDGLSDMRRLQDAEGAKIDVKRDREKIDRDLQRRQNEIRAKGGPNMGADLAAASLQADTAKRELDIRARQQEEDRARKARNEAALAAELARLKGPAAARNGGAQLPPGASVSLGSVGAAQPLAPLDDSQRAAGERLNQLFQERPIELQVFLDGQELDTVIKHRSADRNRTRATV